LDFGNAGSYKCGWVDKNCVIRGPQCKPGPSTLAFHMEGTVTFPVAGNDCYMNAEGKAADLPMRNDPYTIEVWFKPQGSPGGWGIVGWGNWGSRMKVNALRTDNARGFIHYWWGDDLVAVYRGSKDLRDTWHHVAARYTGNGYRELYLDGAKIGTKNSGNNLAVTYKDNFCVGTTNNKKEDWRGQLNNLKIYKAALEPKQIQQIYQSTNPR